MSDEPRPETPWKNGITLKRTTHGYAWTLAIAAKDASADAMRTAIALAKELDDDLRRTYADMLASRKS